MIAGVAGETEIDCYTGHWPITPADATREASLIRADLGDRYEIRRYLSRGGFATVWEAFDTVENRPVAIKRLAVTVGRGRDFYRELRAMFCLQHPNVVRIINFLEGTGTRYLILELCGASLRAAMSQARRDETPWESHRIVEILTQVAQGLAAAHQQGIIHRDIKPENVLFARSSHGKFGGTAPVKLADFGLAGAYAPQDLGVL
ncbi:MAG: serine/threonine-protein kinase, partial [Gemmataceae bacterium]